VDEDDFYEAIASFRGASKRLEKMAEGKSAVVFKDFAHSPSKVAATTSAAKEQYPDRKLIACLELHTYSSLSAAFLKEYKGTLDAADVPVVFYSPEAVKIKRLETVTEDQIGEAFERDDLKIFTNAPAFTEFLYAFDFQDSVLLLMSSGDYGGLDFMTLKRLVEAS
jgi:UDP-N-acetylmuramate: L-alanyl-gamma-D-glutamyl-meso-diaminopimelate ligase